MGLHQSPPTTTGVSPFEINFNNKPVHLNCHWRLNVHKSTTNVLASDPETPSLPCLTLDLLFTPISFPPWDSTIAPQSHTPNRNVINKPSPDDAPSLSLAEDKTQMWPETSQTEAHHFVQYAIEKNLNNYGSCVTAVKLLLPAATGYIVRNDIVERRFLTCQLAEKVSDFTTPRQRVQVFKYDEDFDFQNVLDNSIAAIQLKRLSGVDRGLLECAMASLEADISARLSFPWIVDKPLPRRRLALVDGKPYPEVSTAPLGIYRAARALGVELVVLDHEGHWAQGPRSAEWCDEFISCDITPDDGLPGRIIAALSKSKGPIHNITTYSDKLLPATARAAEEAGLFTSPATAMDICHDKRRTRELVSSASVQILPVTGVQDLKRQLESLVSPLTYPLIVKPFVGYSSEGVTRVSSEAELVDAVRRNEQTFPGIGNLIEPYISGPEVDANFVLMDGELIFGEVNDDFPSSAEIFQNISSSRSESLSLPTPQLQTLATSGSSSKSFAELSTIMPSILPQDEIELLTSSLTETLLELGFKNGVFHLEARVQDSKMEYSMTADGMELIASSSAQIKAADPKVFLIEINPRVPGHQETFAVEYTYGIDYFAMHMLAALSSSVPVRQTDKDDLALKAVIRSLSYPLPEQSQYPSHVVFIPLERGGTFVSVKLPPEELMQYVPEFLVFLQSGELCKDPEMEGKWPFVAYFQVVAKLTGAKGRDQARTIGEMIRKSFEYVMEW